MLFRNAVRYGSSKSFVRLSSVKLPSTSSNAPTRTFPAGRSRKRKA
jgi:hypothetical protein